MTWAEWEDSSISPTGSQSRLLGSNSPSPSVSASFNLNQELFRVQRHLLFVYGKYPPITLLSVCVTQMISHITSSVTAPQDAPIFYCSVVLLLHL